jgi:hypothetical protein
MGDTFGASIRHSGERMLVGAPAKNVNVAHVYRWDGTEWVLEQVLTGSDGDHDAEFGCSVYINGDLAVVGARIADCGGGITCGAAYVFRFDGTQWVEEQKLVASDGEAGDGFGYSVSVDGDVIVAGAPYKTSSDRGAAYVFRYDGTTWLQEQKLTPSPVDTNGRLGRSVDLSGELAVVGAPYASDPTPGGGAVYVFRFRQGAWTTEKRLTASDDSPPHRLGESVLIDGDSIFAGAPRSDCAGGAACGAVYHFRYLDYGGYNWFQTGKVTSSDPDSSDHFGQALTVSGDLLLVGAPGDDISYYNDVGSAHVYRLEDSSWVFQQVLLPPSRGPMDQYPEDAEFGSAVALYGPMAMVGAPWDPIRRYPGAAYVFAHDGSDCNANGTLDVCEGMVDDPFLTDEDCDCVVPDPPQLEPPVVAKNRYLSIPSAHAGRRAAIKVTFTDLPPPHDALSGTAMWVGRPHEVSELGGTVDPSEAPEADAFMAAKLRCTPWYADWGASGTVHVYHEGIVPGALYDIQLIDGQCPLGVDASYSDPLELATSRWGDIVENCATTPCGPPDGRVNVTTDVVAIINKFGNLEGAPIKARVDLEPATPDHLINISDAVQAINAFRGEPYPFPPSEECP